MDVISYRITTVFFTAVYLCGCRSTPPQFVDDPGEPAYANIDMGSNVIRRNEKDRAALKQRSIRTVGYLQEDERSPSDLPLDQPQPNVALDYEAGTDENLLTTLEQFETVALDTNPAVAEVVAEIEALQGKMIQAGLPPNPKVGINFSDINEDGDAGRYGVYFGREIVRGNKLGLSQQTVCAEIDAARQRLAIIEQRLLTDVRQRYYDLLVAQETEKTAKELVEISQRAVNVSQKLFDAQEAARTAVLQSELELENAKVVQNQAANQVLAARRKLAGLLGKDDLETTAVEGDPRQLVSISEFETSFDELVNSSPEIQQLFAEIEQQRRNLTRQCVEPIPNVTWQTTLQYDAGGDRPIIGFQIGMPIPTLNQNQGRIHQAKNQILAVERRAEKKALDLRQRLAAAYEAYLNAKLQVDAYQQRIIPKAKATLDLVNTGYEQGETDFLQLLTAQRTFSQLNLVYLRQLQQAWQQNIEIRGLLLKGSLQ